MDRIFAFVSLMCFFALTNASEVWTIPEKEIIPQLNLRGQSKPINSTIIRAQSYWRVVEDIVPNGSLVSAEEQVVEFSDVNMDYDLYLLRERRDIVLKELEQDLAKLELDAQEIANNIATAKDNLAVREARKVYRESLPLAAELRVAEGRVNIAQLQYEGAQLGYEKALERQAAGFINDVALKDAERNAILAKDALVHETLALNELKKGAKPGEIEQIVLRIEIQKRQIERLLRNQSRQKPREELLRNRAESRRNKLQREVQDLEEEKAALIRHAPRDGYATYLPFFKYSLLTNGGKLRKNQGFMRIADASPLQIETSITEHDVHLIGVGDKVDCAVPGFVDGNITGTITQIASLPRDINEVEEQGFGHRPQPVGIKVYDIVVRLDQQHDLLFPGMQVDLRVHASKQKQYPVIPANYLSFRKGEAWVRVNGVERAVRGHLYDGWFLCRDRDLLGAEILPMPKKAEALAKLESAAEEQNERVSETSSNENAQFLIINGELLPLDTTDVFSKLIRWESKVLDLRAEGAFIQEGDLIITLDTKELDQEISDLKDQVEQIQFEIRNAKEQHAQTQENKRGRLSDSQAELRIAQLDEQLAVEIDPVTQSLREFRYKEASFARDRAQEELQRLNERDDERVSELERSRAERNLQRRVLQLEKTALDLQMTMSGPKPEQRARFKENIILKENAVEVARVDLEAQKQLDAAHLLRLERKLANEQKKLDEELLKKENSKIYAPTDGVIRYYMTRSDHQRVKIDVGRSLYPKQKLFRIANLSKMMVRTWVAESSYDLIREGDQVWVEIPSAGKKRLRAKISRLGFVFRERKRIEDERGLYANRGNSGESEFMVEAIIEDPLPQGVSSGVVAQLIIERGRTK